MNCEIRWCKSGAPATISVHENIGDGCWRVSICRQCADAIGVSEEQDLPAAMTVKAALEKVY